jgi:ABC-type Co2+ transport system permease subunit
VAARFAALALLLSMVTVATMTCLEVAAWLTGMLAPGPSTAWSAVWFLTALLPVAFALATADRIPTTNAAQTIINNGLTAMSIGPASVVLAASWRQPELRSLLAATGLSFCTSLLRMIGIRGERLRWTPARKQI